jgi:G3E family GTPase
MTPRACLDRTPVSIITGFLGSGKTTLLNRLLQDARMAGSAVIINEFGEVGLDHLLITAPSENMVLLRSGCLCCTVRGDLVQTLAELWSKRERGVIPTFDRVLVETTGLADPVPILRTLATDEDIAPRFRADTVLTLVDGVNGAAQLDTHAESVKQAAVSDVLLVSKTDIADAAEVAALEARLARVNPGAQLKRAVRGEVDAGMLFDNTVRDATARGPEVERWLNEAAYAGRGGEGSHGKEAHAHDANRHDDHIRAFSLRHETPVSMTGLTAWLDMLAGLRGANLLRVKGLVNVEGQPVVVHAVQSVLHEPVALARWPSDDRGTRIVFITRDLPREELEKTLALFNLNSARARAATALDPEAYAQFVELAGAFYPGRRAAPGKTTN